MDEWEDTIRDEYASAFGTDDMEHDHDLRRVIDMTRRMQDVI